MAELLVDAIVKAATKFIKALLMVKTAKNDGHKIDELINLVNTIVYTDVTPLQEENDQMKHLKDALEKAKREVDQYLNTNFLLQAATVDGMIKKLRVLRQDIKDRMDVSLHATCSNTNSVVHKLGHGLDDLHADIRALRSSLNNREDTDTEGVDKPPRVFTQSELRARHKDDTMRVSQDLSIPLGIAAVLLRHCHWSPERVKKEWSEHGEKLRRAVGLPSSPDDVSGPKELNHGSSNRQCNICFSSAFAAGKTMISAGCSHYYCNECWRRFISVEVVGRGTQCLSLRCPDPCCQMPVIQELVDKVGNRPLSCDMACLWLDTISSRSDPVLTLTKRCPKCRRMIENERGIKKYVTCPCCHRFWWNCLHPLGGNRTDGCAFGCLWYMGSEILLLCPNSDRYKKTLATKKDEKRQAMASYYYQLWASNHASLQKALEDMDELKESWLLNMANEVGIQVTDLDFLIKAYEEIAECRRVMRWVYPYGYYYLDEKRDGDKCKQLDHLQKEANFSLGRLLDSAVEGKFKLYSVEIEAFADAYQALKTDIMDLARETRHKVEKLVKAVKTDFED